MRYKKVEADFASNYGELVMQTNFRSLKRFGAKLMTREIFLKSRSALQQSSAMVVTECKESCSCLIYMVSKCQLSDRVWHSGMYHSTHQVTFSSVRVK